MKRLIRKVEASTIGRAACGAMAIALLASPAPAEWRQWGGPNRNFSADAGSIATSGPESGPRNLWTRDLGEGYSAVLVEGDRNGHAGGYDGTFQGFDSLRRCLDGADHRRQQDVRSGQEGYHGARSELEHAGA